MTAIVPRKFSCAQERASDGGYSTMGFSIVAVYLRCDDADGQYGADALGAGSVKEHLGNHDVLQARAGRFVDPDRVLRVDGGFAAQHGIERDNDGIDIDAVRAGGDHVAATVDHLVMRVDDDDGGAADQFGGQFALAGVVNRSRRWRCSGPPSRSAGWVIRPSTVPRRG